MVKKTAINSKDRNKTISMEIIDLNERPNWLLVVTDWLHNEWQDYFLSQSPLSDNDVSRGYSERKKLLESHLGLESIPVTFVLSINNKPAGCVSLIRYQSRRDELNCEWLTNLYILEEHRKQGFGSMLVNHLAGYAKSQGIAELYLYTVKSVEFYSRLGWKEVSGHSTNLRILSKKLTDGF